MSRMLAIAAALIATPGMTVSEIGRVIGQTSVSERNCISASLCTMARMGRARHNGQPASSGRRRWYATEQALVDRRRKAPRNEKNVTATARIAHRSPKPPKSATGTITRRAGPKPTYTSTAPAETIEQWMARTGARPEVLPPYASSSPLKFDHADALAKRRGIAHHVRKGAP